MIVVNLQMNACITHHTGISKLDTQYMRLLNEKMAAEREATQLVSYHALAHN